MMAKRPAKKDDAKKADSVVVYWLNEIAASKKREKDYRKEGQRILKIYSGESKKTTPFNILFSNTETLLPALYSAVPRPVVQRRFKDSDPIGKAAAQAGQRVLEFLLDTNSEGYENFDEGVRAATLDALLPGRGITCIKYDADIGEIEEDQADDPLGEAETAEEPKEATPYKKSELVCIDTRSWDRVYFGYAKKWSKVPWVAYEESVDKEEAIRLFGEQITSKLKFSQSEDRDDEEDKQTEDDRDKGERKTALVYQIWDKDGGKKIRYVCQQYQEGFLKILDDPLGLTGFFNCPKPLQFIEKSNDLMPTALYTIYENQAAEINNLTVRINRIVKAIKAKAIYDGDLGEDVKRLCEADDNMLVPAEKTSALAAEKGLQNAIWFWPIDQLIATLVQLYNAREQCKQVIYEITGISDIIRGASVASETATAQNIKTQWGTLRLQRLQREVQRYSRDILRMMLEIAATKFSEETWAKMTGLPFLTTEQRQQVDKVAAALQQQMQSIPQAPAQPGQPPQIPPQMQQQMAQIQQAQQMPVWGQVLAMLKDDTQRAYRIDIETNSTVQPQAVEDQKNISDLMTALGQFLNGVGPLVAKGVMPFEAAQTMMLAITRRFQFGSEIEDQIKAMKAPPQEDNGQAGEQAKLAQEQQQHQAEMQQQASIEAAKAQREQQAEQNRMQLERERILSQQANEAARLASAERIRAAELELERRAEQAKQTNEARLDQARIKADNDTKLTIAKLEADTKVLVAEITAKASIDAAASAAAAKGFEREAA